MHALLHHKSVNGVQHLLQSPQNYRRSPTRSQARKKRKVNPVEIEVSGDSYDEETVSFLIKCMKEVCSGQAKNKYKTMKEVIERAFALAAKEHGIIRTATTSKRQYDRMKQKYNVHRRSLNTNSGSGGDSSTVS